MIIPLSLLALCGLLLFLFMNKISTNKLTEIKSLESKKNALMQRYEFMVSQRRELRKTLEDKENELASWRNNPSGIRTVSASDLDIDEADDNTKVSRYLIQEGKITMEQNEKVLQKMKIMQMDYLGSCIALGFIDLETAKKATKINKISPKSNGPA